MEGNIEGFSNTATIAIVFGVVLLIFVISLLSRRPKRRIHQIATFVGVDCPRCHGSGSVERDLPPIHRGALGITPLGKCSKCGGSGRIKKQTGKRKNGNK